VKFLEFHGRYAADPDPAAAAANLVALVIAWNGPFYPIYVIALIGWDGVPSLLTMLASPIFFAIPWLMRRNTLAGRAALPLVGTLNTFWSLELLGPQTGIDLFLLPSTVLTALLFRRHERSAMLAVLALALGAQFLPASTFGAPIATLAPDEAAQLAAFNLDSVLILLAFLAWQLAGVLGKIETGRAADPVGRVGTRRDG
jgi:hypothetical protein